MEMDKNVRDYCRIAYHLAKSTSCYLTAVVALGSAKAQEQGLELSDNENYVANIMLIIAVNKISMDYQQNPSVVHSLALKEFWNSIYSEEQLKSLQNEMNNTYSNLLINSPEVLEAVGNVFSELGQHDDIKLVDELARVYNLWVKILDTTNHGVELTTAMLALLFANYAR
jgi:hypothetical protein